MKKLLLLVGTMLFLGGCLCKNTKVVTYEDTCRRCVESHEEYSPATHMALGGMGMGFGAGMMMSYETVCDKYEYYKCTKTRAICLDEKGDK